MTFKQSLQAFSNNTKQFFQNMSTQATQLYDKYTSPSIPDPDPDPDEEAGLSSNEDLSNDRFIYNPTTFPQRLAVGGRAKNKLKTSTCVKIPYRVWCKYLLILCLVLFAAFFTPQLLPQWLGFEWSRPKDLCQNREQKLRALSARLDNATRLPELHNFLSRQQFDHACMDDSAKDFYARPARFQWPDECTPEKAQSGLSDEVCVGPFTKKVCVGGFFGRLFGACKSVTVEKSCKTVADEERTQALLDLRSEQAAQEALGENVAESQPIVETANDRATQLINRLLIQVDIASDIYIGYSILALIFGMPLIVYKREKGSRIVGATFGMKKVTFIIVVVIFLSMYDSLLLIVRETNFARLFRNFRNDPCYVDPEFSRERVNLIIQACGNVTQLGVNSTNVLQDMDDTYYTTRRFAFCKDSARPNVQKHPKEGAMDTLRRQYRDGDLQFPGTCNVTALDEATSSPPSDPSFSKFKALLGSGVIAQLFLKLIFTSWLVHVMAYQEPMIMHNGKVEIWDTSTGAKGVPDDELPLSKTKIRSAVWFARDKHLLPLIFTSVLMAIEVFLIIYSIVVTNTGRLDLQEPPPPRVLPMDFTCPL